MKEYILNYYPQFKCTAGDCKHTCCACWETDIDAKTLQLYKEDNSPFNLSLKKGINFKKRTFKQGKSRRCAFLNDKGLCEIIINLGEEKLCQICSDHPRFKSNFTCFTETGLGFCCEEATKIILSYDKQIAPVLVSDDGANESVELYEKFVIDYRESALKILQDRTLNINERIKKLLNLCNTGLDTKDYKKVLKALLSYEKLNKSWALRLKSIKNKQNSLLVDSDVSLQCEQFLVNSIYRHISTAEDTLMAHAITLACVYAFIIIQQICNAETKDFNTLVDIVREYSSEVEYSPKNIEKLFNLTSKFII